MAQKNDFVIRIGGEAGEGVQSTGDLAVQVAARAGYYVLTHRVPPAEIKGGLYEYQIRLANGPLYSQGDELDILLAFNEEAYQSGIKVLKPDGLLIYDSAEFTPPDDNPFRTVPLPLTDIAKTQLKFALGKNVVAVGAVGALFGLPIEYGQALLMERFGRKGEEIVAKNVAALEAGIEYVKANIPGYEQYQLAREPAGAGGGDAKPDVIVVTGSQAVGLGTLAAGCRHVFGYPITPASDVLEWLAAELPKVGGVVVQAEDELAAMAMVVGAGYSGVKAMTPTSGPGVSLMTELLGLAVMAEIPVVLVDVQRAGPSTGMPTRHEQGDVFIAALGGHGEVPRIVLACTSVADAFYQTVNAFNLAEKYQVPVIYMSDTSLGTRSEAIARPDLAALEVTGRQTLSSVTANGDGNGQGFYHFEDNGRYKRYNLESPTGVNPMPIPGEAGGEYVATGLEHNEYGRVRYDVTAHSTMTDKRFRKMETAVRDAPEAYRYGDPGAEVGIITWGSTAGTCTEAIDRLREQGVAVDLLAPKMLWPLPVHQLEPFIRSKRRVLVVEVNYQGQWADLITARLPGDYERINTYGGVPFTVAEICEAVVGKPMAVAAD